MKKIMIISTFAAFLFFGISCGNKTAKTDVPVETEQLAEGAYYTCPMHPEVQSEKPGDCPKCGMPLEIKEVSKTDTVPMIMPTDSIKK